jgi:hypothetical protein
MSASLGSLYGAAYARRIGWTWSTPAIFYWHIRNAITYNHTVFFQRVDPTYAKHIINPQASAIQNTEIQYNSDVQTYNKVI